MKEVGTLSDGRVALSTGTLYGAIKRLLAEGWIQRSGAVVIQGPGRPRQAYNLTRAGRRVLKAESSRLNSLVSLARARALLEGA
jgi:DNA-binding PadR family transcriptional regulator